MKRLSWDQRLAKTAKAMIAATSRGKSAVSELNKLCPQVHRQLLEVRQQQQILKLWGQSINFDEVAQDQIVHPAVLAALGELTGTDISGEVVHAGLQHTYGYLLSLLPTPYGFKRERWIETGLERSLGLHSSIFGPAPREGSLLANLTYFFGRVAFKGRRSELAKLRLCRSWAARSVVEFPYRRLKIQRIIEEVSIRQRGSTRRVAIITDLMQLPDPQGRTVHNWLLYSTADQAEPNAQLITAFNVSDDVAKQLLAQKQGRRVEVPLRYNLYLPGVDQQTLTGRRSVHGQSNCL